MAKKDKLLEAEKKAFSEIRDKYEKKDYELNYMIEQLGDKKRQI